MSLGKVIAYIGGALFLVMALLMIKGTYNHTLFYVWGAVCLLGTGLVWVGQQIEKRETYSRLEAERQRSRDQSS